MIILRWLVNALALLVVANVVPGFTVASLYVALIAAIILGLLNAVVKPILLILTLPINIVTLGLFTFVVNGVVIYLASTIVKGFDVATLSAAIWAAVVLWLISIVTSFALSDPVKPSV